MSVLRLVFLSHHYYTILSLSLSLSPTPLSLPTEPLPNPYSFTAINVVGQAVLGDSSSEAGVGKASEQPQSCQKKNSTPTSTSGNTNTLTGNVSTTTAATKKPRQLTRRNTSAAVSHPGSSSRPRGTTNQTRSVTSGRSGTGNPSSREKGKSVSESSKPVARKKALSPPTTPTPRLLPATPVRRSEKAHLAATTRNRPKSMTLITGSAKQEDSKDKTAPNTTSSISKESPQASTAKDDSKVENSSDKPPMSVPELPDTTPSCQTNPISGENSSEGGSEKLSLPQQNTTCAEKKTKHTVAYKDTSPLYKDGELSNTYAYSTVLH